MMTSLLGRPPFESVVRTKKDRDNDLIDIMHDLDDLVDPNQTLLTTAETLRYLGISRRSLVNYMTAGLIAPAVTFKVVISRGRTQHQFNKRDLDRFKERFLSSSTRRGGRKKSKPD